MKISEGKDFQTEGTATVKCLEAECSSHVDRTMAGVARETGREGGDTVKGRKGPFPAASGITVRGLAIL